MSSSQSLTTLDVRGFHSLIASWLAFGVLLRRCSAAGDVGAKRARTADLGLDWTGKTRSSGWANPLGAGCEAIARSGFSDQGRNGQPLRERQKGAATIFSLLSAFAVRAVWDED